MAFYPLGTPRKCTVTSPAIPVQGSGGGKMYFLFHYKAKIRQGKVQQSPVQFAHTVILQKSILVSVGMVIALLDI